MSEQVEHIPVVEEAARLETRRRDLERVTVRAHPTSDQVTLSKALVRERVEVERVPIGREVAAMPDIREEGDTIIVPVVEERLVVEKRLFLVEELRLVRRRETEEVAVPVTLRRTEITIERAPLTPEED